MYEQIEFEMSIISPSAFPVGGGGEWQVRNLPKAATSVNVNNVDKY